MTKIFKSVVSPATVDRVWQKIRDFNALPDWHQEIAASEIENNEPSDRVGCVRCLRLKEGGEIREQLLTLSDVDHLCCYTILESPLPLSDYIAVLTLVRYVHARMDSRLEPAPAKAGGNDSSLTMYLMCLRIAI